jgi:hypothetical protein
VAGVTGVADPTAAAAFQQEDRVACNFRGNGIEYMGKVAGISEGLLAVQYDDGERERIAPSMCRRLSAGPAPAAPPPEPAPAPVAGGCQKDTDCKGDRVCDNGRCVNAPARQ